MKVTGDSGVKYTSVHPLCVTRRKVEQHGTRGQKKPAAAPGRHSDRMVNPEKSAVFSFCTLCREKGRGNSQFYGFVPHDDVTRQDERLDVDDVRVAALRPHVEPFALEGKVAKRDPGRGAEKVGLDTKGRCDRSSR